jgi:hypothetical protein
MPSSSSVNIAGVTESRRGRGSSSGSDGRPETGARSPNDTGRYRSSRPSSTTTLTLRDPATAETVLDALASGTVTLTELPLRLQAIAATLGWMLSEGYSRAEIARFYGKSRPWVSARLQEIEDALLERIDTLRAVA